MNAGIQNTLLQLRTEHDLTQEQVANHLGITKAAVSKWECGQSMPDIALLPAIADLYSTTIDALFGREEKFAAEDTNAIYTQALELLGQDYESGLEYIEEQVREHWASYPLLHMLSLALFSRIPMQPGFGEDGLSGKALECAQETERLVKRAMELASSEEEAVADLTVLTRILAWTGRTSEAESLVEGLVRKEPNLSAVTLAQLYRESGRDEQAMTVLQRAVLIAMLEAESAIVALAPLVDERTLVELVDLASALQPNEPYVSVFPIIIPTLRMQQAKNAARSGEEQQAIEDLDLFARDLDRACLAMTEPVTPSIFEKVQDMMWSDATDEIALARSAAVSELRASYANSLETEELWGFVKDAETLERIIEHVRTGREERG